MKPLLRRMFVLMILLCAVVIPVSATITKEKTEITYPFYDSSIQISPSAVATCDGQETVITTVWRVDTEIWKVDIQSRTLGSCDEGTTFRCIAPPFVTNGQTTSWVWSLTGSCWFYYLDGSQAKKTYHATYANGEMKSDFTRWN